MSENRILIVDDESIIRRTLAHYLDEWGYDTVTAEDGAEGLELALAEKFDVVLVDLRMPKVDGLEVIDRLQAANPELPIVVISGTGVLRDAIEAMRRGASDYISKPVQDMEEVAIVVERVLEQSRLRAERDQYQQEIEDLNRSLEAEVARQTADLTKQNIRLVSLNRVSFAISGQLDLDTVLNRAIDAAIAAVEADGGVVRLLNRATDQLIVAAARGMPASYIEGARTIPIGQGVIGQVAETGHAQLGYDFAADPWLAKLDEAWTAGSYICVPLRAGEEPTAEHSVVGTLSLVVGTERALDSYEVELLTAIGNQIGVAVARAQYAADLRNANVELERVNAELRRMDTLREQFIQNVAHELRTPLALVRGYVEMLSQGDLEQEDQDLALDVTRRRVETLVDLVEGISTLQDISSRPLKVEQIEPPELLRTASGMIGQRSVAAGIDLKTECPSDLPRFPGDFTRLAQALHQLLDNACKFSPDGGVVTLAATATKDKMEISVTDQGIGISPDEHDRIFERFYQVDGSMSRRFGGTGLGLALVKEIIEAHQGTVTVTSDGKSGATFTMQLPLRRADLV